MVKCSKCGDIVDCYGFIKPVGFICLNCLDKEEKPKRKGGANRGKNKILRANQNKKIRR